MTLVALVAVLVLTSCARGAAPTATLAPYTEVRTNGDPTPGDLRITSNNANGLYLVVVGDVAAVTEQYRAAWQADGWHETERSQTGTTTILPMQRGEDLRLLLFTPEDGAKATMVFIKPPRTK
jgi:hypothetical protein